MKLNKKIFSFIYFIVSINCNAQFFPNFNLVQISQEILSENTVVINDLNNQKILVGCNHITLNRSLGPNGSFDVACYKSDDGGNTWAEQILTINSLADPAVAFDNTGINGTYYLLRLASENEARVFKIDDNAFATQNLWLDKSVTGYSFDGVDKTALWIDNNPNSPYYHNIYYGYSKHLFPSTPYHVCMRVGNTSNLNTIGSEILLSNFNISPAGVRNHSVNIKTDKNGIIYSCWAIYDYPLPSDESGIGFASYDLSTQLFTQKKRIQLAIRGTNGSGIIGTSGNEIISAPAMAVNQQNGHIFIVWTNQGEPGINQNTNPSFVNPDVYFIKSTDGGNNWSTPVRINDDYNLVNYNGSNNNYLASIACDPITGTLAVIYYDSRERISSASQTDEQVYVALSDDEGESWTESLVSNNLKSGATVGHDYIGIDIKNNFVVPVYSSVDATTLKSNTYVTPVSIACPDNDIVTACNQSITTVEKIKAANTITISSNASNCFYNVTANGGDVTAYAGNYVKMQSGFHAAYGSLFHAFIKPCNAFNFATHPQNRLVSSFNSTKKDTNNLKATELYEVYPNPIQDIITIKAENSATKATAFLFDSFGRLITSQQLDSLISNQSFELNLQSFELRQGVYFLKIVSANSVATIKLVKK